MSGYDFAGLVIGPPKSGKTTKLRSLVDEHLRAHPTGLALVHDPNLQFQDLCATYEDVHAWRRALAEHEKTKTPFPRGAAVAGDWSELRDMAIAIGRARNRADRVRVPILLACDESSLMADSGRSHIEKAELQLLSMRRHWGIGPVYNAQQATSLVDAFYALSTHVFAFRQVSEKETRKLEERFGLPEGRLASLVTAPKFHYVELRAGEGLV